VLIVYLLRCFIYSIVFLPVIFIFYVSKQLCMLLKFMQSFVSMFKYLIFIGLKSATSANFTITSVFYVKFTSECLVISLLTGNAT